MAASSSLRTLEITLISAKDLKNVNFFSRLSVYTVATLSAARPDVATSRPNNQQQRQRTPADREGRRNPTWNCPLRFSVPVTDQDGSTGFRGGPHALHFVLRAERAFGDRVVGEVHVPLAELEADSAVGAGPKFVSYQVRRPSGRGKGVLNFSYRFLDTALPAPQTAADVPPAAVAPYLHHPHKMDDDEPITAYPVSSPTAHSVYPPPPHPVAGAAPYPPPHPYPGYPGYPPPHLAYSYGPPPPQPHPAGYGYPPPSFEAYTYRAAAARPPVSNKRGGRMGLGMGLLGGALGGIILGDAMADAADGGSLDF